MDSMWTASGRLPLIKIAHELNFKDTIIGHVLWENCHSQDSAKFIILKYFLTIAS